MSESSNTDEPTIAIDYVQGGKTERIYVNGTLPPLAEDTEEAPPALGETAEERAENDALLSAMTKAFHGANAQIKTLARGGAQSVLHAQDAHIEQMMRTNPTGIYLTRCALLLRPDEPIDHTAWRHVETFDLTRGDTRRFFAESTLGEFASMKPAESHVRLLVLESVVATENLHALVRFIVYFMREAHHRRNEYEHAKSLGKPVEPPVPSEADDDIRIVSTVWGFTLQQHRTKGREAEADAEAAAKRKRLHAANQRYLARRLALRSRLLQRRVPVIVDFIVRALRDDLVARLDAAAPNLPPRVLMRVEVANSGATINLDETYFVSQAELRQSIATVTAELQALVAKPPPMPPALQMPELTEAEAAAAAATAADDDNSEPKLDEKQLFEAQNLRSMLDEMKAFDAALSKCDPESELLINIVEPGQWNDNGIPCQTLIKIRVSYAEMRAAMKKQ